MHAKRIRVRLYLEQVIDPKVLMGTRLIRSQCVTKDRRSCCTHRPSVKVSKGMTAYSLENFRPALTSAWFSWERKNSWRNTRPLSAVTSRELRYRSLRSGWVLGM